MKFVFILLAFSISSVAEELDRRPWPITESIKEQAQLARMTSYLNKGYSLLSDHDKNDIASMDKADAVHEIPMRMTEEQKRAAKSYSRKAYDDKLRQLLSKDDYDYVQEVLEKQSEQIVNRLKALSAEKERRGIGENYLHDPKNREEVRKAMERYKEKRLNKSSNTDAEGAGS